jgi:4-hydroxy-tetrahydrodipicolinate reductase
MPPTIAIHGATGKLGRLIVHECGLNYVGSIGRTGAVPECDVVIDVSSALGTAHLLPRLNGQALLIGTTGDLPLQEIEAYSVNAPVAIVPNFSIGIPAMIDVLQHLIPILPDDWDIEIVEAHHNQKKDAPSGTAKKLAQTISSIREEDIPTHALRIGDTFGEHTIYLSGPGERIELRHVATQRRVFAIGECRWAEKIIQEKNGLYVH